MIDTFKVASLLVDNETRAFDARIQYETNEDSELRANLFEIQRNAEIVLFWLDTRDSDD